MMSSHLMKTKKILIFGGNGTVGLAMRIHIARQGQHYEVHCWDRAATPLVPTDNQNSFAGHFEHTIKPWLELHQPFLVYNFAVASEANPHVSQAINVELPGWLGEQSLELGFRFIHTSSVMVFDAGDQGPYALDHPTSAKEGYGLQKKQAEDRLMPLAIGSKARLTIARLGWQIDPDPQHNTMRRFLENQALQNSGLIKASTLWNPSCARLEHTVNQLWILAQAVPGLYQIEGNPGMNFADIVSKLRTEYGNRPWVIERTQDFVYNQTMSDPRIKMPPLFSSS